MIAVAPLDPERTAILMLSSSSDGSPDAPALDRAADLLSHARASGAHVVHVRHLSDGGETAATASDPPVVAPAGGESVLDSPDSDPFTGTDLAEVLDSRGVDAVVVVGPTTPAGCDAAASHALSRNFRTVVADDATVAGGEGAREREQRLRARMRAGAEVLSVATIGTLLDASAS